jgi:16S rRNA (uracil1498-N3)-methyltransferase
VKFNEFINQNFDGKVCIAHCEEQEKKLLKATIGPLENTTILIGPEGDFSLEEIKKAFTKK